MQATADTSPIDAAVDAAAAAVEQIAARELAEDQARINAAMQSPLDRSLQRGSPRPRTQAPSVFDVPDAVAVPNMLLSPEHITTSEHYNDETKGYAEAAVNAITAMRDAVVKTIAARAAVQADPTLTPSAAALTLANAHEAWATAGTKAADAALATLSRGIATLEAQLSAPVTANADSARSQEVRGLLRSMAPAERTAMVNKAIAAGDSVMAEAVLGVPSYLSGVADALLPSLVNQYHSRRNPKAAQRLALMQHAADAVNKAAQHLITSGDAIRGVRQTTVAKLRAQQQKTRTVIGALLPGN